MKGMKPGATVFLCHPCARYARQFMRVLPRRNRGVHRCQSCGKLWFNQAYDLEQQRRYCSFWETVEGCTLGNCAPEIWKPAQRAFRELPYEVQHDMVFAPKSEDEFERRGLFWRDLLLSNCSYEDAMSGYQAILRWYDHIKRLRLA